jgi:NitT/TauT family transport system ATP-binding protein
MELEIEPGEMEVSGVNKSFIGGKEALIDVNFKVEKGTFTCLCGPSGCGKTTLINLLAGYDMPDRGSVHLDGQPVKEASWDRLVIFQETALFPWMTVWDNALFGPRAQGIDKAKAEKRAQDFINRVALTGFEDKYPMQLSGGMQRRAELVRTLVNDPKVMLMDEPFRGLDAMTREIIQEYVIKLYEETKVSILFITAELEEAIYLGDVVYFLTAAPGTIKEKMEVDLPRPRLFEHTLTERFQELQTKAIEIVDEEAVKAFGGRR